jgi:hypothetical protein
MENRLTVISEPFRERIKNSYYSFIMVRCICGVEKKIRLSHFKDGLTKSCGCISAELRKTRCVTHGMTKKHSLYSVWCNIKNRCRNKNVLAYKDYGGRGISICEEWSKDFKCFYDWCMNNGWAKGLEIDRKNNDGNYEPSNCRFVTTKENMRNKRNTLSYEQVEEIRRLKENGVRNKDLSKMFNRGATTISAITTYRNWI